MDKFGKEKIEPIAKKAVEKTDSNIGKIVDGAKKIVDTAADIAKNNIPNS